MIFRLEENKKAKSGGPVKHPYSESALKAIGNKELPSLFYAFLYETFIVSNFGRYENVQNCVHTPIEVENTTNSFIFEIMVKAHIVWFFLKANTLPPLGIMKGNISIIIRG